MNGEDERPDRLWRVVVTSTRAVYVQAKLPGAAKQTALDAYRGFADDGERVAAGPATEVTSRRGVTAREWSGAEVIGRPSPGVNEALGWAVSQRGKRRSGP